MVRGEVLPVLEKVLVEKRQETVASAAKQSTRVEQFFRA